MKDFKKYLEIIQEINAPQEKRDEIKNQINQINEKLKYKKTYKKFEDFSKIYYNKFEKFADELESYAVSGINDPEDTEFKIYVIDFKVIEKNIDYIIAFCKVFKTIDGDIESQYFLGFYDNNKKENYVCYNDTLEKAIKEVNEFNKDLFSILSDKKIQMIIEKLTHSTGVSSYS